MTATRASVLISLAVFCASSPWFSGTAVVPVLQLEWRLGEGAAAWLTSAVQLGFVLGTFTYAALNLADIFNARRVFCLSALAAAACNLAFGWLSAGPWSGSAFRMLTGFFLAGVYPVGMKLVASWFREGLGWRLGLMVGALTAGSASPFLIRAMAGSIDWRLTVSMASLVAVAGGTIAIVALDDGPYLAGRARFEPAMVLRVFAYAPFRRAALAYFGHMWELYAFWTLVPLYLHARFAGDAVWLSRVPAIAFLVIAAGVVGCVTGGWMSRWMGESRVAVVSLVASAAFCAASGAAFAWAPAAIVVYVVIWGVFVVADSPQFSALSARACPPEYTATALTIQNGIGFAITIVSIQLLPIAAAAIGWRWSFTLLTVGPLIGACILGSRTSGRRGRISSA